MGYYMDSADWPTDIQVPIAVMRLMDRLCSLLDENRYNVGDILADEIFAKDGVAYFGSRAYRGTEEIRRSRDNAWETILTRRHEILKVYVSSQDAGDLLFIANVAMGLHNGKKVEGEFTGRVVIDEPQSSDPKLRLYQVWGDSSALVKAIQGN